MLAQVHWCVVRAASKGTARTPETLEALYSFCFNNLIKVETESFRVVVVTFYPILCSATFKKRHHDNSTRNSYYVVHAFSLSSSGISISSPSFEATLHRMAAISGVGPDPCLHTMYSSSSVLISVKVTLAV